MEISLYTQRNPTRLGQSYDHLQGFKIHKLGTLKAKKLHFKINANRYFEISLCAQRNPTRLGQSCYHLQEFKIHKLGTLKQKKNTFKIIRTSQKV